MRNVICFSCHPTLACAQLSALISSSLLPSCFWMSSVHMWDGSKSTGYAVKSLACISGFDVLLEFYGNTSLAFYHLLRCFCRFGARISRRKRRPLSMPSGNVSHACSYSMRSSSFLITPLTSKHMELPTLHIWSFEN